MAEKIKNPRRGDIYLVNFDPTVGSEIKKTGVVKLKDDPNQLRPENTSIARIALHPSSSDLTTPKIKSIE